MSMTLVESTFVDSIIVVAAKDQIGCNLGEEEVILDLASGVYYGLNNVASRIWELVQKHISSARDEIGAVQKPTAVGQIVEIVLTEYDVDRAQCIDAVNKFLSQMAEHGLLEQSS